MAIGLVGRKCGMTRLFTEEGESIPVSVVDVSGNRIVQVKTAKTDGYNAVQLTYGSKRAQLLSRPEMGHFAKAEVAPGAGLWEFSVTAEELEGVQLGTELGADKFAAGQKIDARGISKGKGFAGAIKRWNFGRGDETHGNSRSHRSAGSIGQNQSPGRVFPGKKMAGRMGGVAKVQQNLSVAKVDVERGLVFIKGSIPGSIGGDVLISHAIKSVGAVG